MVTRAAETPRVPFRRTSSPGRLHTRPMRKRYRTQAATPTASAYTNARVDPAFTRDVLVAKSATPLGAWSHLDKRTDVEAPLGAPHSASCGHPTAAVTGSSDGNHVGSLGGSLAAHCRARLTVRQHARRQEEKRLPRRVRRSVDRPVRHLRVGCSRRDAAPTRAAAVSPLVVTVAISPRSASVSGDAGNRWPRSSRTSVADDPAPLDRFEMRIGHAGSEGAHRTLRYQRAALPAGQFSMTPTVSYPSRS